MSYSRPKQYVDCSVQTDLESRNTPSEQHHADAISSLRSGNTLGSKLLPITAERSTRPGTPICKNAYSHSQTLKTCAKALVIQSRQDRKLSTIGCGRPSELAFSSKRIASLPSSGNILGRLDEQIRLASMPERGKFGALNLARYLETTHWADNSVSANVTYSSTDLVHQSLVRRNYEAERAYPADIPQTPSPPSSPESVMSIANEERMSGSVLRRDTTDESGWTTWANSPPRPIPALHGPSSLPYARCPSGAEGTLIEGDDLSHKIWGLGSDNAQTSNCRPNKTLATQSTQRQTRNDSISPPLQPPSKEISSVGPQTASFQRERDLVIDLSKLSTFRTRGDTSNAQYKYAPHLIRHNPNMQLEILGGGQHNRTYLPIEAPHNSKPLMTGSGRDPSLNTCGLGLKWNSQTLSESRDPTATSRPDDIRHRLNNAAPVFIPGVDIERQKVAYMHHMLTNAEPAVSQQFDEQSPVNTASQYPNEQDYHLPTPPSTSPHWSPTFSQPNEFGISSRKFIAKPHTMIYPSPKIYSPQLDLEGYPSRLSAMVEQLNGQSLDHSIHVQRFLPVNPMPITQEELARQVRSKKNIEHTESSLATNKLVNRQPSNGQESEPISEATGNNGLLFSSERRPDLSHQHPRSIPLARLIQRRLSSVVEENSSRDNSALPLCRKKVSELSFNRLSRGPPHFCKVNDEKPICTSDNEYTLVDESAVSVEDLPMPLENSNAVVKLPAKPVASRANQNSGPRKNFKIEAGKENNTGSVHGKLKNKHRKKDSAAPQV